MSKQTSPEAAKTQAPTEHFLRDACDIVFVVGRDGMVREYLGSVDTVPDLSFDSLRGKTLEELWPAGLAAKARDYVKRTLRARYSHSYEYEIKGAEGSRHCECLFVVHGRDRVLVIVRDISERRGATVETHHLAYFDTLTALPNRQLFMRHLERELCEARLKEQRIATLYIDLDHFKHVNDNLGRSAGDQVLKLAGQRLSQQLRTGDRAPGANGQDDLFNLARVGGDEFAVFMRNVRSSGDAEAVTSRLSEALSKPFGLEGNEVSVTPSIGIAMSPQDGTDAETLVQNADTAMHDAKAGGRNRTKFYSGTVNARTLTRIDLEAELRSALHNEQLELNYQPKADLRTGELIGVEALLRWPHAIRGWVPPSELIPFAENTGMIIPIGEWVLREACQQVRDWTTKAGDPLRLAVNLSGQQLSRRDLPERVHAILEETGFEADRLELEVTEGVLARGPGKNSGVFLGLRDLGVKLMVDDFGTATSSIGRLRRWPIDALKIDRTLVANLPDDTDDVAICSAIIALARELSISVVAEGVETRAQLECLRDQGCDEMQGFFLSEPLPPDELLKFLEQDELNLREEGEAQAG